jgi:hypothetical protein
MTKLLIVFYEKNLGIGLSKKLLKALAFYD